MILKLTVIGMGALPYCLDALLTRKMLNIQAEHEGTGSPMGHLASQPSLITRVVTLA